MLHKKFRAAAINTLLALVVSTPVAEASTVYTVTDALNRGQGRATGFIETDGTVGVLSAANIVDWNLHIVQFSPIFGEGSAGLFGPLSGNNSTVNVQGSALSATATGLFFDFGSSGPTPQFVDFVGTGFVGELCLYGLQEHCGGPEGPVISFASPVGEVNITSFFLLDTPFTIEIATAQTPLPAALPLFATGLGALGLFAWRRKKKAAALAA